MFSDRLFRKFHMTQSNLIKKLWEFMSFLRYDKKKEKQTIYQILMIVKIIFLFADDLFPNDISSVEVLSIPTLL